MQIRPGVDLEKSFKTLIDRVIIGNEMQDPYIAAEYYKNAINDHVSECVIEGKVGNNVDDIPASLFNGCKDGSFS
jgi:hypothetical protein